MSPKYSFRDLLTINVATLVESMGIGADKSSHSIPLKKKEKNVQQDCLNIT